jgi:uncharacterized protein
MKAVLIEDPSAEGVSEGRGHLDNTMSSTILFGSDLVREPVMLINLAAVVEKLANLTPKLRRDFHVSGLHVFGSVARNEARSDSDLDILVEFTDHPTFARFMDLKFLLEDEFQVRVDLVTRKALRPELHAQVMAEARRVA